MNRCRTAVRARLLCLALVAGAVASTPALSQTLPQPLTLVAPTGVIVSGSPTYVWNAQAGVDSYQLWVGTGTTTVVSAWYTAAEAGCEGGVGTCAATPPATLASGAWYFNVKGRNAAGTGPWAASRGFTVGSLPPALTLISPSGATGDETPTYTWNAAAGVESYLLWVGTGTATAISTWYTAAEAGCAGGAGACSVTPATALATGAWYFNVRGKNAVGTGPWAASRSFAVATLPSAATLVAPAGDVLEAAPTYRWSAVAGADSYQLWVGTGTTTVVSLWYPAAAANCASGQPECSATPATTLGTGRWYFNVRAKNGAGTGPWAAASKAFTRTDVTAPGALALLAPSGAVATTTPAYSWSADAGVDAYQLWVGTPTATAVSLWYTAAEAGCGSGETVCAAVPATALAVGAWYFNVRGRNEAGTGPWAASKAFTVAISEPPAAPTLVGPVGDIWNAAPAYTWQAVPGADSYQLWVGSGETAVDAGWHTAAEAGCPTGSGMCAITSAAPLTAGPWTFRVQGQNGVGTGPWSADGAFTVQNVGACEGCHNGSQPYAGMGAPNVMTYWTGSGVGQDGGHGDPGHVAAVPCTQCHDLSQPAAPLAAQHGTGTYNSLWDNATRSSNTSHLKAEFFTKFAPSPAGDHSVQVAVDNYCMWQCHNPSGVDQDGSVPGHRHYLPGEAPMTLESFIVKFDPAYSLPFPGDAIEGVPVDADLSTDALTAGPATHAPCVSCHDPHGTGVVKPVGYRSNYMMRYSFPPSNPTFLCARCHFP